jgi:hypothetical protein
MNKKLYIYSPDLSAETVKRDYGSYPYNLRTMRACRKVERECGCPYVSTVGGELMRQDGLEVPIRGCDDGTPYSYLAYCATVAHHEYQKRKKHRRLVSLGWRLGCDESMVGQKVVALIHGEPKNGRIVDAEGRHIFMPSRNRTRGYLPGDLYLKAA